MQLSNLKSLYIGSCGNLKSMPPIHVFPSLEDFGIANCHKLKLSFDNDNQVPKLKLKFVTLESLPQLVSVPKWLQGCADTLQTLGIDGCENLDELPEWLSTINTLGILNCPKVLSLPDDVHCLPNLEFLCIDGCPELCRTSRM